MPDKCCVVGCRTGNETDRKIMKKNLAKGKPKPPQPSIHKFPNHDPSLVSQWIKAVDRNDWVPSRGTKICSLHFKCSDFIASSVDESHKNRLGKPLKKRSSLKKLHIITF